MDTIYSIQQTNRVNYINFKNILTQFFTGKFRNYKLVKKYISLWCILWQTKELSFATSSISLSFYIVILVCRIRYLLALRSKYQRSTFGGKDLGKGKFVFAEKLNSFVC